MNRPVALITGASAGIGMTFARKLAARGYDLILVARRADRLRQLAGELGVPATPLAADLTTEEGVCAVEQAIRECPRLSLLVNNAGFGTLGRFWETDFAGQEAMYRLHVWAVMRLCRATLAGTRASIINVSSVAGFAYSEGNVSYCSTKAWMNSFTEALSMELRGAGSKTRVQALCPGFTVSEFHDTLGVDRSQIPGWLWMSADEVVETSLRGLEKGQVIVIPGWKYRLAVAVVTRLPAAWRRRMRRPGKDKRV